MAASSDGPRQPALHLLSVAIGFALCMILSGLEAHFTTGGAGLPGTALQHNSNASFDGNAQTLCVPQRRSDAMVAAARRNYQQLLLDDAQRRFSTKVVRFAGLFFTHLRFASLVHAAGTLYMSAASCGGV